jgi:hypothetical protein
MLSLSYIYEYNTTSLIDIENEHTPYSILLLHINISGLSSTNRENGALIVLCSATFHLFIKRGHGLLFK